MATLPPASRSPMMPDPTTAARSKQVPTPSATNFRDSEFAAARPIGCVMIVGRQGERTRRSRLAATRVTAGGRLLRSDEGTGEASFDLGRESVHIEAIRRQEGAGILDAIDPPGFELDVR